MSSQHLHGVNDPFVIQPRHHSHHGGAENSLSLRQSVVNNNKMCSSYITAAVLVKNLVCINLCAECGIALIATFNEALTKDEQQKKYLLQVVEFREALEFFYNCIPDSLKNCTFTGSAK